MVGCSRPVGEAGRKEGRETYQLGTLGASHPGLCPVTSRLVPWLCRPASDVPELLRAGQILR